jgi:hypothetical protein
MGSIPILGDLEDATTAKPDTSAITSQTAQDLALTNALAAQRNGQTPTAAPQTGGFAVGNAPPPPPPPPGVAQRIPSPNPPTAPASPTFANWTPGMTFGGGAPLALAQQYAASRAYAPPGAAPIATSGPIGSRTASVTDALFAKRPDGTLGPNTANVKPPAGSADAATKAASDAATQAAYNAPYTAPRPQSTPGPAPATTYVGNATQANQTNINTAQSDQTRAQQEQSLNDLHAASTGAAPSVAEIQQRQGLDNAVANQYALAASLGGRSVGGALRTAAHGAAGLQQAGVNDAASLRANEIATARAQESSALQGVAGQDANNAQAQAALTQGNNQFNTTATNTLQNKVLDANTQSQLANLNAQLQTQGMDENERNAILAAQLQAMGYAQSGANSIVDANTAAANAKNQQTGTLISTLGSL